MGYSFSTIRGTRCPTDDMPLLIDRGGEGARVHIEAHKKVSVLYTPIGSSTPICRTGRALYLNAGASIQSWLLP